jgi:hypothetical protein
MPRKIVISVGLAAQPVSTAGLAWYFISWVLGFRELGWDVWMVEGIDSAKCVDTDWKPTPFATSANRTYWESVVSRHGLAGRATLLVDDQSPDLEALREFAADAEIFLNISGHFKSKAVPFPKAVKVYVDGDPGFTQVWADAYACDMNFAAHDVFFSVGQRLGQPGTFSPTCGITWHPTFPPVLLSQWPFEPQTEFNRFTTVAHWYGYPPVEWNGVWFTGKAEEFNKFVDLPRDVPAPMEIATNITAHADELQPFRDAGWRLTDARIPSITLDAHEAFVRGSSAEFSAAKGGYVASRTGWFSDRSVCYLAAGRPVVLQDTGLGDILPRGDGFHTFTTPAEAAAACRRVIEDFPAQQRAARRLAEEHLATSVVIPRLLERL